MKFYISADIEGVAGVVSYQQILPGRGVEWERARGWMTDEVVAAAETAHERGAEEVIISDSHASGENLLIERLPDYCRLVRSLPRPLNMVQGVEEPGIAACAFIGYHASGQCPRGLLTHTFSSRAFRSIRLNGVAASEAYANAAVAGEFRVPLIAITGDADCIEETRQWFPTVEVAAVKQSYSRLAALTLTPAQSQALIRGVIARGLERLAQFAPFVIPAPIVVEIEFIHRTPGELLSYLPWFERTDTYAVRYTAQSMAQAMRILQFVSSYGPLAGAMEL